MKYSELNIVDLHRLLVDGEINSKDLIDHAISLAKEDDNNCFEYICEKESYQQLNELDPSKKNCLLYGIPFVLKDNFSTKDIPTTASSNILNGYKPIFSSEVYQRLIDNGAILIGKTTMDELAMGGMGVTGHLGKIYNPWDPKHEHIVGGSSGGSASAVSAGIVPFSIGSDTGDSVRKPASYSGIVGFKPTWGRISRHGLFPFAPSLDTVGFFTKSVADSAIVLGALAGEDEKDTTCAKQKVDKYFENLNDNISGKRIAIIDEIVEQTKDENILKSFNDSVALLASLGAQINHITIDKEILRAVYPTYVIISCSESSSNNANLDGIKFGNRIEGNSYEETVIKSRSEGFSAPIKKRFIIGGYALSSVEEDNLYVKALRARRLIVDSINKILEDNDVIYLPSSPTTAPRFDVSFDKMSDAFLIGENHLPMNNFSGLPSLTLPIGFSNNMPFGANITGRAFGEQTVLNVALALENKLGLKDLQPKKDKK